MFRIGKRLQSTISYSRKGDQPAIAPVSIKSLSKLANGVSVATVDGHGPAANVAVYIHAGARFDAAEKPGVAHLLKRSIFRVTIFHF